MASDKDVGTGSTTLFRLITFKMIQKLENLNLGFKDDVLNVTSLIFADDILLVSCIEDTEIVVRQVVNMERMWAGNYQTKEHYYNF